MKGKEHVFNPDDKIFYLRIPVAEYTFVSNSACQIWDKELDKAEDNKRQEKIKASNKIKSSKYRRCEFWGCKVWVDCKTKPFPFPRNLRNKGECWAIWHRKLLIHQQWDKPYQKDIINLNFLNAYFQEELQHKEKDSEVIAGKTNSKGGRCKTQIQQLESTVEKYTKLCEKAQALLSSVRDDSQKMLASFTEVDEEIITQNMAMDKTEKKSKKVDQKLKKVDSELHHVNRRIDNAKGIFKQKFLVSEHLFCFDEQYLMSLKYRNEKTDRT